jgi:hypothetical protein
LARAGRADDPRVASVGEATLDLLEKQYADPENPPVYADVVEIDEGEVKVPYRRLNDGAVPIDHFTLYLLAYWPGAKSNPRARKVTSQAVRHLFDGRHETPKLLIESEGKRLVRLRVPHIADWTKERYADRRLGFLLHDLELLARTGTLTQHPKAVELLEWVLSLVDGDGVLHADTAIEKFCTRSIYHYFPLEDSWRGKHKKYTDATFRLALILRLLDRLEDAPA